MSSASAKFLFPHLHCDERGMAVELSSVKDRFHVAPLSSDTTIVWFSLNTA